MDPPLPYVCPAGVDCAYMNSCPGPTACPRGWLCASYAGHAEEGRLDAAYMVRNGAAAETGETWDPILTTSLPPRWWEGPCPRGFFCSSPTTVALCPPRSWCPDGAVIPLSCSPLSYCPGGSSHQLDFVASLLALLVSALVVLGALLARFVGGEGEGDGDDAPLAQVLKRDARGRRGEGERRALLPPPTAPSTARLHSAQPPCASCCVSVSAGGVPVLHAASLSFPLAALTAILGPSGCGKTTLLHSLLLVPAVRSVHSSVSLIPQDDVLDPLLTIREAVHYRARAFGLRAPHPARATAVVLRELGLGGACDVLVGAPEAGQGKGGGGLSGGQAKRASIALDLVRASSALVGGAEGGVTLHAPPLILLDEPTSGLDASASWSLALTLHALSRQGVTVVAALHQPRREVWACVDHVILMCQGAGSFACAEQSAAAPAPATGGVVYSGPRAFAVPYLLALGLGYERAPPPPLDSEADWLLDVVTGLVQPQGVEPSSLPVCPPFDLAREWAERGERVLGRLQEEVEAVTRGGTACPDAVQAGSTAAPAVQAGSTAAPAVEQLSSAASFEALVPRSEHGVHSVAGEGAVGAVRAAAIPPLLDTQGGAPTSTLWAWVRTAYLQAERTHTVRLRDTPSLLLYSSVHVLMAAVLSLGYSVHLQGGYTTTYVPPIEPVFHPFLPPIVRDRAVENSWDLPLQQLLFFLPMIAGSSAGISGISLFGARVPLLQRDTSAGLACTATVLGSMAAEVPLLLWGALLFTGVWMLFAPPGPWWWWLATITGAAWAASGLTHVVSAFTRPANAAVILTLLFTVSCVLSGVEPRLAAVKSVGPGGSSVGLEVLWFLSFATWAGEAAYATWAHHARAAAGPGQEYDRVQAGAAVYGYRVDSIDRAALALFALGVLWRALACVALCVQAHRPLGGSTLTVTIHVKPERTREGEGEEEDAVAVEVKRLAAALRAAPCEVSTAVEGGGQGMVEGGERVGG